MPLGRILAFSVIAIGLMGLGILFGIGTPHVPSPAAYDLLPAVTFGVVVSAALADGFNPCAFTVLLLFVTSLLAASQSGQDERAGLMRARVVGLGSIYIASVFLTYLALGVGLLASADVFTQRHLPARLAAVFAIGLGLWMLKDSFIPEFGAHLEGPRALGRWARRIGQRGTIPALIGGGILIGICTLPCSGAVYLAVLALLAAQPSALTGFAYLVLYNALFVLPLVVILILASVRPMLNRLAHWNLHYRQRMRLALGSGVVVLGFITLAII